MRGLTLWPAILWQEQVFAIGIYHPTRDYSVLSTTKTTPTQKPTGELVWGNDDVYDGNSALDMV
jgi:hypothetical protein